LRQLKYSRIFWEEFVIQRRILLFHEEKKKNKIDRKEGGRKKY
jgi:hypothetical protein